MSWFPSDIKSNENVSITNITPAVGTNYGSYYITIGNIQIINFVVDIASCNDNTTLVTGLGTAEKSVQIGINGTTNAIIIETNGTARIQYAINTTATIRVQVIRVLI